MAEVSDDEFSRRLKSIEMSRGIFCQVEDLERVFLELCFKARVNSTRWQMEKPVTERGVHSAFE